MVDQSITTLFNEIYRATSQKTLIYLTARCNNPSDISDLFQETYVEVFSVIQKRGVDYIQPPEAFVIKIAKQRLYRHYTLLEKWKLLVPITPKSSQDETYDIPCNEYMAFSVEDKLVNDDLIAQINAYLSQKPDVVRKICYLYYSLDLTIEQIANELHLSESNVKNKLYRTRRELRNQFKI